MMSEILSLATAALKPGQQSRTENKMYPRVDYIELKRYLDVDVLDYDAYRRRPYGPALTRLETNVRSDVYLAWLGFRQRKRHKLVFAWSERVGIPYAGLRLLERRRSPFATMFTCWSDRQEKMITSLNLFSTMDTIAVHCESMRRHFISLGVPENKVKLFPYSIDHCFFSPLADVEQQPGLILSLGEIRSRDYRSLFKAVKGLPVKLWVAAAGSWYAREKKNDFDFEVPGNVYLSERLSAVELRNIYAQSQFVVLPVYDEIYSAGATASLEAMAMGRAVIAFRSRGILDFVRDGQTGLLVEPGNPQAMREAIQHLLENPDEARRLGENGRQLVREELNLDNYVRRIAAWLTAYL
jgi:glycosyltransferase involved in cell wall biosynthesis